MKKILITGSFILGMYSLQAQNYGTENVIKQMNEDERKRKEHEYNQYLKELQRIEQQKLYLLQMQQQQQMQQYNNYPQQNYGGGEYQINTGVGVGGAQIFQPYRR